MKKAFILVFCVACGPASDYSESEEVPREYPKTHYNLFAPNPANSVIETPNSGKDPRSDPPADSHKYDQTVLSKYGVPENKQDHEKIINNIRNPPSPHVK